MKKIVLGSFLLASLAACSNKPEVAEMKFETEVVKVDTINQGDVIDTAFVFTNTGNADLIIKSAKASCGCTVADYPKEAVAPGQIGKVYAKFNSSGKRGKSIKTITIEANTSKPFTFLKIETFIKSPKATIAASSDTLKKRPSNSLKSKILKPVK
ncbi:DUF1573 domain-containing protein [Flavobacterium aurantiibacter]|uniref:DUF1573 domain-containing protein n=1 Tax=Flavobacterium aurantiibacter TaxID=2023067 RepID=A0A255ZZT6_9FLAO|nr:DUF1573 domain-containing protein [Flavobacterium aurantiibacter]OYQ46901.1 hypothetical protein CHX27_03760 [Flavobacterium aurantiibacter]